jgi:hypothetical protein
VQVCGLNSLMDYFSVKTCDIWEGNCDNKEGHLNCAHMFPRVSGDKRGSDITEFSMYCRFAGACIFNNIIFSELKCPCISD